MVCWEALGMSANNRQGLGFSGWVRFCIIQVVSIFLLFTTDRPIAYAQNSNWTAPQHNLSDNTFAKLLLRSTLELTKCLPRLRKMKGKLSSSAGDTKINNREEEKTLPCFLTRITGFGCSVP